MCNEVQNVGAINFTNRGSKMVVSTVFDEPLGKSSCVGCGQCAAVCPTGALVVKMILQTFGNQFGKDNVKVVAQIAPAVRVAVAKAFGLSDGDVMGKIVAAMHRIGFEEVFDTVTGADLTVLEEANEFLERLSNGEIFRCLHLVAQVGCNIVKKIILNCCLMYLLVVLQWKCLGSVIKEQYKTSSRKIVSVAIMPCTAKKFEAARPEFKWNENQQVIDYVITTQELIQMIKEAGIVFSEIEPESIDMPFGSISGAGVIFGVTGGVTEAVIRRVSSDKSLSL